MRLFVQIEPLIRPLFAAYPSRRVLYGADPGEAAPHADAALSDLVIPIERYTRLLCCIGPWLPLSDAEDMNEAVGHQKVRAEFDHRVAGIKDLLNSVQLVLDAGAGKREGA